MDGADKKTLQAEINKSKNEIRKKYGWHFLAKSVADFCNITFFDVFEKTAQEIFSVVMIINAQIQINETQLINR